MGIIARRNDAHCSGICIGGLLLYQCQMSGQKIAGLWQHFVSVLEIYEIGPKFLDRFPGRRANQRCGGYFYLKAEDIKGLERFGEKSADNIIDSSTCTSTSP